MKTVLHTESSPGLGGQEIRTLTEAGWIAERGWRVLIAAQPHGRLLPRARELGLAVVAQRMRGAWDPGALLGLVQLIRREQIDVVHTHSSIDGWLGGMAARLTGRPVLRTRHVSIPIRRGLNPVYRWLADRVITSGEAIRQLVIAAGVPPARVVAIPAGVKLDDFADGEGGEAVLRSLGLAGGPSPGGPTPGPDVDPIRGPIRSSRGPIVGSVAMFRGSKGHDHLLDAFSRVHARRPDARLLLVGDGGRREWAERLARERGLSEAVVFTGFRTDVPALLAAMDCFVLASTRTEGVPQSLLQAAAAGIPLVASRIGGIPEVVEDGVTGLLVSPEDPAALAAAIEQTLADPAAAAARARAGRKRAEERFSHSVAMTRLLALYDELLAARGR
ncbi:MAG TPA: glycosyltransferase [Pseudomonadales bacterium]|nr:glycosyltransferase [Pseudomonadales bacterium]